MLNGLVKNMNEYKYIYKKVTILLFTFSLSLSMIGCIKCKVENEKTQNYMNVVVNDITADSLNVAPVDNESVKEDPLKIDIVFAIYVLNENGEVIPNK